MNGKMNLRCFAFLLFLSLFAVSPGNAQVVFTEDFESGWGGWFADNGVWEVGPSTLVTGYHGAQCAGTVLNGNYPDWTNSRLVSPSIILPAINSGAGEELHLRFWHWFSFDSSDGGYVQISQETSPGVWSAWANVSSASLSSGVWTYAKVEISAYA